MGPDLDIALVKSMASGYLPSIAALGPPVMANWIPSNSAPIPPSLFAADGVFLTGVVSCFA
jgi:hypothetical protein